MFFNGNAPVDYAFAGMFPRGVNPTVRPLTFFELPDGGALKKKGETSGKICSHFFTRSFSFFFLASFYLSPWRSGTATAGTTFQATSTVFFFCFKLKKKNASLVFVGKSSRRTFFRSPTIATATALEWMARKQQLGRNWRAANPTPARHNLSYRVTLLQTPQKKMTYRPYGFPDSAGLHEIPKGMAHYLS